MGLVNAARVITNGGIRWPGKTNELMMAATVWLKGEAVCELFFAIKKRRETRQAR
jgi:hypothetical protein